MLLIILVFALRVLQRVIGEVQVVAYGAVLESLLLNAV